MARFARCEDSECKAAVYLASMPSCEECAYACVWMERAAAREYFEGVLRPFCAFVGTVLVGATDSDSEWHAQP